MRSQSAILRLGSPNQQNQSHPVTPRALMAATLVSAGGDVSSVDSRSISENYADQISELGLRALDLVNIHMNHISLSHLLYLALSVCLYLFHLSLLYTCTFIRSFSLSFVCVFFIFVSQTSSGGHQTESSALSARERYLNEHYKTLESAASAAQIATAGSSPSKDQGKQSGVFGLLGVTKLSKYDLLSSASDREVCR